jgi:hypothetical protein
MMALCRLRPMPGEMASKRASLDGHGGVTIDPSSMRALSKDLPPEKLAALKAKMKAKQAGGCAAHAAPV